MHTGIDAPAPPLVENAPAPPLAENTLGTPLVENTLGTPLVENTLGTPLVEIMVTEELDARSEPRVRALLEDALTLHPEQLIIDLADCPFIDATAIGMLLDIHRRVWISGGRLTLRAPSPRVRRTLQIAHVNHVLRMVPEDD